MLHGLRLTLSSGAGRRNLAAESSEIGFSESLDATTSEGYKGGEC